MESPVAAPDQESLQIGIPNAARIYDYLLGGKDHYDADRQAAKLLLRAVPDARRAARENRAFLGRVVRYLAGAERIGQFLDIGSGLPAAAPVHEIARQVRPDARVAYADHDPVVVAHARALLAAGPPDEPPPGTAVLADLRDPGALLDAPGVRAVIDFSRPVAVLLVAVLHFVADEADPAGIIAAITSRLAPGSCVAISHVTADFLTPEAALTARAAYAGASVPAVPRTREQVAAFFDGLAMIPPGLSDINGWRPALAGYQPGRVLFWAGAGRVRPLMPATGPPPPPGLARTSGRADYVTAARDVPARAAEADYPGWSLSHGLYGWTAVRARDSRTEKSGSLPGLRALITVAGR